MNTETKVLGGVLIASIALIIGAILLLGKTSSSTDTSAQGVNIDYSKGQKIGSDSAKVKLAEFSDLQCPACKAAEPFLENLREKYKDKIQFIYFHFPLMQHIHARKAANFAEYAATQGKFWQIHDKLFETQDSWSALPDPTEYFADLGAQFGLDKDQIRLAVKNSTFEQKINESFAEGTKAAVNATPSFYLNSRKLNLQNFTDLDKLISEELQKK